MKKVVTLVLLFLVLVTFVTGAFALPAIPNRTEAFYVNDFANIFTDEEEALLISKAKKAYNDYYGMQIVVTTITSFEDDTIENYAIRMYNDYKIGVKDMGILILFSLKERKVRIETGKEMEIYVNDAKASDIIKRGKENVPPDNINEKLINMQALAIDEAIKSAYPATNTPAPTSTAAPVVIASKNTEIPEKSADSKVNSSSSEGVENTTTEEKPSTFPTFLLGTLSLLFLGSLILLIVFSKKKKELAGTSENNRLLYEDALKSLNTSRTKENSLSDQVEDMKKVNKGLQADIANLKDWIARVCILYPEAEDAVAKMIQKEIEEKDKAAAKTVDDIISNLIYKMPDRSYVKALDSALKGYFSLTDAQKRLVTNDISRLKTQYEECLDLEKKYNEELRQRRLRKEADEAQSYILSITSGIMQGDRSDLYRLQQAKQKYNLLSDEGREYFDQNLLLSLNTLLQQSEQDQRGYEEEQSRYSYSSSSYSDNGGSSYSSYDSSSSVSVSDCGGGGSSDGGGATGDC